MPEQQEWWETDLRRMFHGVWAASPHNEQRMTDAAIEAIKPIFARHRKMIVKEIREEIDKVFAETGLADCDQLCDTCGDSHGKEMRRLLSRKIFSIPCLKENE